MADNQNTVRHIASPISHGHGRPNLCGAEGNDYGGIDEAYRANVEGWTNGTITCRACVRTVLVALGVPL